MSECMCVCERERVNVCVSKIAPASPGYVDQKMITSQKRTLTSVVLFLYFLAMEKIGGSRRQSYRRKFNKFNTSF